MTNQSSWRSCLFLVAAMALVGQGQAAETITLSQLAAQTHIHGLAVDRQDPAYLLIATHHGLFRTRPDGRAERISAVQDFMGFNPHPTVPNTLFASGHPQGGGNLGFIESSDHGRTWSQISPGAKGPVDFHQMSVSPADPRTVYGAYGELQVSHDSGKTWAVVAPVPDKLIALAASAKDAQVLYAATEDGLLVSQDGGATWTAIVNGAPVSMVDVGPDGAIYAFILGQGLVRSAETPPRFQTLSAEWGDRYLLHLAVDPINASRMFASTQHGEVLASTDGGKVWGPFGQQQ